VVAASVHVSGAVELEEMKDDSRVVTSYMAAIGAPASREKSTL